MIKIYKITVIILSLLLPAHVLFSTQEVQQPQNITAAPQKKERGPWYKKATNWLLLSGVALGAVLTGAVVNQKWQQYQHTSLMKSLNRQLNIHDLEALKEKNKKLIESDANLNFIYNVAHLDLQGFTWNEQAEYRKQVKDLLLNYINTSESQQSLEFRLKVCNDMDRLTIEKLLDDQDVKHAIKNKSEPSNPNPS
jgi:uncharacterized protein HemX